MLIDILGDLLDLILMDLSLPEIDGWEAIRQLKADNGTARIPIIAITGHVMAGDREKAFQGMIRIHGQDARATLDACTTIAKKGPPGMAAPSWRVAARIGGAARISVAARIGGAAGINCCFWV